MNLLAIGGRKRAIDRLGRLYDVAARPAMGKSLLSLEFAPHAAMHKQRRLPFASLEMSDSETEHRDLAAETGVDPERLHLENIKAPDWPALLTAASGLSRCSLPPARRWGPLDLQAPRSSAPNRRPPRRPATARLRLAAG